MNTKEFENKRWKEHKQGCEFRHTTSLDMAFSLPNIKHVLDLGCGDGFLMGLFKEKGIEIEGADISSEAVIRCKENGLQAIQIDTACNLPFVDKSFDLVFLLDILEHLYDPTNFLKDVVRISNQYIILSVPNFNSLPARIQVLLGRVPENNKPSQGHIYWFNKKELEKMIKKMNLTLIELKTNTFWENVSGVKYVMKFLKILFPSIFALSFTVMVKTK